MSRRFILVLGGARGGKSRFAQELAARTSARVLFVATAEGLDDEMRTRIEEHKRQRPPGWRTIEVPRGIAEHIRENLGDAGVVLVDCLTLLVSNLLTSGDAGDADACEAVVVGEIERLMSVVDATDAVFIIISNEVGMGLVPDNPLGRVYRDLLGKVNQLVASRADEVYLMVSGVPLKVKG